MRWYTKNTPTTTPSSSSAAPTSAICYAHGGGMIALSIAFYDEIIKRYVTRTGIPFLLPEYRLAPEVRAPTPVTDVYASLQYLHSHAQDLNVDPTRIAIMGDSAGGGIAASLAHYAKIQTPAPKLAKQILIYPMLDDRNTHPDPQIAPYAVWSYDDNITGWGALLGDRRGGADVKPHEAAGRMTVQDAQGLPPAYIDVGELDIFRDEDLAYAKTLTQAGVSCELHLLPGVPHAFEGFATEAQVAIRTMEYRCKAITSF